MHQYESDVLMSVDRVMARDVACIPLPDVIKQEGHLAATAATTAGGKSCLEPSLGGTNGYCLNNGVRDNWPTFRDTGFSFPSPAQEAKMAANLSAAVTASSPAAAGQLGQFGPVDWPSMSARAQAGPTAGQYYHSPPLVHAPTAYATSAHHHHHPHYGWSESAHGHAQSAYAYGMTSSHANYRQSDGSPTGYPYTPFGGVTSLTGAGTGKDTQASTPSIQDMDAERTIRRARRNRTCFSKHQMESLEEVFKESRYPDVYRREEIAATLDLKEEVVRVWFKNRRAKLKRENKDGKVTSPGSPTSTTPSPKSTTSPNFPTSTSSSTSGGSALYPSATSYSPAPAFLPLPLKADHVTSSPYFAGSYTGYAHSTVPADSAGSVGQSAGALAKAHPIHPAGHVTSHGGGDGNISTNTGGHQHHHHHHNNNNNNTAGDVTVMYSGRGDVTSSYASVKCEPTPSDRRDYVSGKTSRGGATGMMTSPGSERSATSSIASHHHTLSPSEVDQ